MLFKKSGLDVAAIESTEIISKVMVATALVVSLLVFHTPRAEAQLCNVSSTSASCTYKQRGNGYWCGLLPLSRNVRWQVPEGTPPAGGWKTAFYYNGTVISGTSLANPFSAGVADLFGAYYQPQILRELLDNPGGTGPKYAVFAPEPPASLVFAQFWHTNSVFPYELSCDYAFFPDFWGEIKGGSYGSASQYNMNQRYAYGISSGGYNTSRMAVTFNSGNVWKALGIVSASYATCAGPLCTVPSLPSNHPPTKFWHGLTDFIVPEYTMEMYYNQLVSQHIPTEKVVGLQGHQFTADDLGATGIKNWFDSY